MSTSLKMKGTVEKVFKKETGETKAGKEWTRRGFVLNNGDKYNPLVYFSVFGEDKVNDIFKFKKGDEVEVSFNLGSREHNGKYYTQADAWAVQNLSGGAQVPAGADEEEDDLPF